ncbi:MAG: phosphatidylserine decarboxylase [Bacteroides sp.]|nr:phosphatidylserine decarboxylase [Bacteroides sp.]MCM1096154.1 phosphatidylserine decarboxylase [Terasakiella sp.]
MANTKYQPIVQELADMIERNGWTDKFKAAIEKSNSYNIEDMQDVKDLDGLLRWLDGFVTWVPFEDKYGSLWLRKLCKFFFIFDLEPVKSLQTPEVPAVPQPKLTELSQWIRQFIIRQGEFLDTPESLTPETLATFRAAPSYNIDEYVEPRGGWKSFNEFFARYTKPGYRPIAAIDDDHVIVAAAEATFSGQWEINSGTKVNCKGLYWSIEELLEGSPYKDEFKGGMWTHSFLNTNDFHRQIAPVSGRVVEARVIQGATYVDMEAVPVPGKDGVNTVQHYQITAPDKAGYEFMQTRGLIIIDSPIGLVAVMPIGMSNVSSVVITAEEGRYLHKGEEISYFQFGGSDYVMVFQERSNVSFTAQPGVHYKVGTKIADAFPVVDFPRLRY